MLFFSELYELNITNKIPGYETENPILEFYNISLDSKSLGIGITFLTINAQKENLTTQNIVFKVEVLTRETFIDNVFINNTETQAIEVVWNELFNITVTYTIQ